MTVEVSTDPRSHASALRQRVLLQLALAAFGALPVHAHDEGLGYAQPPPPAVAQPPGPPPPAAPPVDGQWVFTRQYGWVWMPYAQSYTYVPAQGDPNMFVYGPTLGWHWVAAPWVFDYGPVPYWGPRGRAYFSWYSRPWFARRDYRGDHARDYRRARSSGRDRDYREWRGQRARESHEHQHSGRHR